MKGCAIMFYTFNQNNSGGGFDEDEDIAHYVIIEAVNATEANKKAKDIGIYFNGCDDERDCNCCGDRWYETDESDGTEEPMIYSKTMKEFEAWFKGDKCIIHGVNNKKIIDLRVKKEF